MKSFDPEQYLEQLRKYYSGDRENLDQFLQDMNDSLNCYLQEHPNAEREEIYQHFGHPDELRENYEATRQEQKLKKRKRAKLLLIAALVLAAVLGLGSSICWGYQQIIDANGHDEIKLYISPENETLPPIETPSVTPVFYYENEGGTTP